MKLSGTMLILTLALAASSFADQISGTLSAGVFNLKTPEGVIIVAPADRSPLYLSVNPITGAFAISVDLATDHWNDLCSPARLSNCTAVELFAHLSGTLSSLPTLENGVWSVPNQSLVIQSTSSIIYMYVVEGSSGYFYGSVGGVPTEFLLALNGVSFTPGLDVSVPPEQIRLDAVFPIPTPEPASLSLVLAGSCLVIKGVLSRFRWSLDRDLH